MSKIPCILARTSSGNQSSAVLFLSLSLGILTLTLVGQCPLVLSSFPTSAIFRFEPWLLHLCSGSLLFCLEGSGGRLKWVTPKQLPAGSWPNPGDWSHFGEWTSGRNTTLSAFQTNTSICFVTFEWSLSGRLCHTAAKFRRSCHVYRACYWPLRRMARFFLILWHLGLFSEVNHTDHKPRNTRNYCKNTTQPFSVRFSKLFDIKWKYMQILLFWSLLLFVNCLEYYLTCKLLTYIILYIFIYTYLYKYVHIHIHIYLYIIYINKYMCIHVKVYI